MDNMTAPEYLRQENGLLKVRIKELEEEVERLKKQVEELLAKLNKNSSNSSKPPSSNGFKKIPNNREKSGRSVGGQKGHEGRTSCLPDNFEALRESGAIKVVVEDHTDGSSEYVIRYTVDVRVEVVYTEHRFRPDEIPAEFTNAVTYGDETKALATLLVVEGAMSLGRVSDFFDGVTNGLVSPSEATVNSFLGEIADNADIESLISNLLEGDVMNVDDTSVSTTERPTEDKRGLVLDDDGNVKMEKSERKSFNSCVRTYSNEKTTVFTANGRKNNAGVIRDGILPKYEGTLVHDFEAKFMKYGGRTALCGEHLKRELKFFFDCDKACPWSNSFVELLKSMCHHKNEDLRKGLGECDALQLETFIARFDELAAQGRECVEKLGSENLYYRKLNALTKRLVEYKDEYTLFMRDYRVPFTNNLAERDLRSQKLRVKVSGCFRSFAGMTVFCKLKSIIATAKKRGANVIDTIKLTLSPQTCTC